MTMSQRFLLDQMFDCAVHAGLREAGFDVLAVSEIGMSSADDAEILQWAITNARVVITLDDHFGDWAILPLDAHSGVIRLKVNPTTTTNTLNLLLPFLKKHQRRNFSNHLVIVRSTGIRWIRTAA
jgi:predicted nuclease of predicted toxin-antitoxin system